MQTLDIPWNIKRAGPQAEAIYTKALSSGQSERFAELAALRQPPGIRGTNDQYMRGLKNGGQFNVDKPLDRAFLGLCQDKARRAGVSLEGKYYSTQCAEEPGDLRAWFSNKDEEFAYIRSRGWTCRGGKIIKGPEVEVEETPYCVSDEIVDEEIEKIREEHPEAGATPRELADLKDSLRRKLSGVMYGKK